MVISQLVPVPPRLCTWAYQGPDGEIATLPVDFAGLSGGVLVLLHVRSDGESVDVTEEPGFLCVGATIDACRATAKAEIQKKGK